MEKLNELVEQAKFVADWYGSDWSSALCQGKDGKQAHEIICESRGEAVISTGSNSNEASWLCDYLELCSPANILAIAEAFRALEQRAEAAEAKVKELEQEQAEHDEQIAALQGKFDLALAGLRSKTERCGKAETELEALKKQHPIGRVDRGAATDSNEYPDAHVVCLHEHVGWEAFQDGTELFTRPAPALSLADMVSDEDLKRVFEFSKFVIKCYRNNGEYSPLSSQEPDEIAAILRNIEEAK